MVKIYIAADTGPSGFGVASKELILQFLEHEDIELNVKTHFWGWNREGFRFQNGNNFGDTRFREHLIRNGYVNEDYLIEDPREAAKREEVDLTENLDSSREAESRDMMVKQFEGKEDVWMTIGGAGFAEQAPQDDDIHTILSTDFNLDVVPRRWEHYFDRVDEIWVPSEWVHDAIRRRFGEDRPELVEKTRTMVYGVPQRYEPTEYDCEACPNQHENFDPRRPNAQACLRDDKFNFLVVSRFYHIKGLYRTVKAFIEEFRGHEPVRLFVKTTSNQQFDFNPVEAVQSVVNELGYPDPPEIGLKVQSFDSQHLYDLMGHCDAFIQASRAECFGIAQFQAAYCETPVIANGWAAQEELIPDDNDGFLKLKDSEVKRPSGESGAFMYAGADDYPPDSHWATPDIDELGDRMRELFEMEEEERERRGREARKLVEEEYDWDDKAKPRIERVRELG